MKYTRAILAITIYLTLSHSMILNAQSSGRAFLPKIQSGIAIVSGNIERAVSTNQEFGSINLDFTNVVTGNRLSYKIPIKSDGSFSMSIPISCISFASVESEYYQGLICLIPGEESKLKITIDKDNKKHITLTNNIGFTADDANTIINWPWLLAKVEYEMLSPESYAQRVIAGSPDVLKPIYENTTLSAAAKQVLVSESNLVIIYNQLLNYNAFISDAYKSVHKTDTIPAEFHPQFPTNSYYALLKYYELNDPTYLSATFYPMVLQSILTNELLAIPKVGDTPIDKWLVKVKKIFKDSIGSDSGMFYDLMASNALSRQLNEMKPFSDIQLNNITTYFTNKSIAEALFNENQKVIKLIANSSKVSVHNIPEAQNNVMDSIIAMHKGKVIFIDFWATWCGPCQQAIQESESVKKDFENKDVVFIYITDHTSPLKTLQESASKMGGEHYYLTKKGMSILSKDYNIETIPHYLVFDQKGLLKHNHQSFMGKETMRKWLEELLQNK